MPMIKAVMNILLFLVFRYSMKSVYQAAKSGNAEKLIHVLGEYCVIDNILMRGCVKEF
jgi:hypothetical protein